MFSAPTKFMFCGRGGTLHSLNVILETIANPFRVKTALFDTAMALQYLSVGKHWRAEQPTLSVLWYAGSKGGSFP